MKSAFQTAFGSPDVITIGEISDPTPASGEVLIRVKASSMNPLDTKLRGGGLTFLQGKKFPKVQGCDVSGEIAAVGAGVTTWKVGDEVSGLLDTMSGKLGAHQELVATGADRVRKKPA